MAADLRQKQINSEAYWELRFKSGDWDQNNGEAQAGFFGDLAVRLLPSWLLNDLKANNRSVADLGCAEGAGTAALSRALPGCRVVGVDFAAAAIERAKELHQGLEFIVGSIDAPPEDAEVFFLSNVLEHFADPQKVLHSLATSSRLKYLIVLVPLHEVMRHQEHLVTFDFNNFPLRVGQLSLVAFDEVDLRGTPDERYWYGKQAFAVWAHHDVLEQTAPTLQGLLGSAARARQRLGRAQSRIRQLQEGERERLAELTEVRRELAGVLTQLRQLEERVPAAAPSSSSAFSGNAVQFLPDREAEMRADEMKRRLNEFERTLKWRLANRAVEKARGLGLHPLLKLVSSIDEMGVKGTTQRVRRALKRRLWNRRRLVPFTVNPWVSLRPLKPIEVQVIDEAFVGQSTVPFSVVTTVRNEAKGIVGFLSSIAQQSATPDELVVVDGGSSDETVSLVHAFAQTAPFRVVLIDEGPCNIAAGRNRGLSAARHEVVLFLDAGCTLRPHFFSAMVGTFARFPSTDLVGGLYVAAADTRAASSFVPDWKHCDYEAYLPSARAIAVRATLAKAVGGFPEHLSLTGEDTLFDVEYRRVSKRWVINRAAVVEWSGPSDERAVLKLTRSYCRGDGESGLGDRRFYAPLSEFQCGTLAALDARQQAAFEGYLEGRRNRITVERDRRHLRGVVLVVDVAQLTDHGGDRRVTSLVTELTRQMIKVVHVSLFGPDEPGERFVDLDQTLLELYQANDFRLDDYVQRYAPSTLGVLVVGAHPALVPLVGQIRDRLRHVAVVLDEADDVALARVESVDVEALATFRRWSRAQLVAETPSPTRRHSIIDFPDAVDGRVYRHGIHERRPSQWPVRWKEQLVVCPVPFEVPDADGLFVRSVARACPALGFCVLAPSSRLTTLMSRWGVIERNLIGSSWNTPNDLGAWVAYASAVVLPWSLEGPGRTAWAAGWARRAAALGVPTVARDCIDVDGAVTASPASFASVTQSVVAQGPIAVPAGLRTWQENVHQLLSVFLDFGRS
jgi:glycosyltransferase involved in cell wall biosynthesis/SAM-dependent methyltransferase